MEDSSGAVRTWGGVAKDVHGVGPGLLAEGRRVVQRVLAGAHVGSGLKVALDHRCVAVGHAER